MGRSSRGRRLVGKPLTLVALCLILEVPPLTPSGPAESGGPVHLQSSLNWECFSVHTYCKPLKYNSQQGRFKLVAFRSKAARPFLCSLLGKSVGVRVAYRRRIARRLSKGKGMWEDRLEG